MALQLATLLDAGNWTILPNATPTAINFDLTLNERGQTNSVAPDTRYGIIRRDNSLIDWLGAVIGTHNNATQITSTGTVTAKRTIITNVNVFGDFAIGFGSGALPVELLTFQAKPLQYTVKLFWQTASENDNDYFVVEHSKDDIHFEDLVRVEGAHNSNTLQSYLTERQKSVQRN